MTDRSYSSIEQCLVERSDIVEKQRIFEISTKLHLELPNQRTFAYTDKPMAWYLH